MAKVFTCPHCGAGAGPHDSQCWRCGGSLTAPVTAAPRPAAPGIREISKSNFDAAPVVKPAVRDVVGAYGREKELRDKERALQAEMESLESQNRKVEKLFRKLDEEKRSLETLKASLSAREDEIYTKAAILQSAMHAADVQPKTGGPLYESGSLDAVDPEPVLAMEKARLRQELEKEMADQLDRITQLEESLSAQEDELYTKAAILQSAMRSTDDPRNAGSTSKNASILYLAAGGDLEPVLVLERSRMRKKIESEMAEQFQRLAEREAGMKSAYAQMGAGAVVVSGLPDSLESALACVRCLKTVEGGADTRYFRLTRVNGVLTLTAVDANAEVPARDENAPADR